MNANELSEQLKHWSGNRDELWNAANMLCQQADRIAELEKDLKKYDQLAWDDLSNPKTIWCDCGDGITANSGAKCGVCASTPQTKPLSDEEIKTEMGRVSSSYPTVECLIEFARAILRKAQE